MQFADGLDSNCYGLPLEADGPTNEICGNDAVTWVELPSGTRRYLCPDHADRVERFGEVEVGARIRICDRCLTETPVAQIDTNGGEWACGECMRK